MPNIIDRIKADHTANQAGHKTAQGATLATAAIKILSDWEAADDELDGPSGADLLIAAGLYHTRDEANMRAGMPQYVPHQVVALTFEDGSRAVQFTSFENNEPLRTPWTAVAPGLLVCGMRPTASPARPAAKPKTSGPGM